MEIGEHEYRHDGATWPELRELARLQQAEGETLHSLHQTHTDTQ